MGKLKLPETCGIFHLYTLRIRLAAHFHAEHLLDREHYMDWLVSALENSPQAKLPLWLLITQIYWKDLLQYRKFGRRLAAALMNQMAEVRIALHSYCTNTKICPRR